MAEEADYPAGETALRPLLFLATAAVDFFVAGPERSDRALLGAGSLRMRSVYCFAILINSLVRDRETPRVLAVSCAVANALSTLIACLTSMIIRRESNRRVKSWRKGWAIAASSELKFAGMTSSLDAAMA